MVRPVLDPGIAVEVAPQLGIALRRARIDLLDHLVGTPERPRFR
jgi:hypothetical protein